jgi:hypothetical protein
MPMILASVSLQSPITIGQTTVSNNYPEKVTFEVEAATTAGDVTSVELQLTLLGDTTTLSVPAEFTPGAAVHASVEWETRLQQVPPGAAAEFAWKVRDSAGNVLTSDPFSIDVEDSRFQWQTLRNDELALWWYDGDRAFGQNVFDTAVRALDEMRESATADLDQPLHVVLYANQEDFSSWHNYVVDWVAGEAYPWFALTVQIVPQGSTQSWVQDVIPHEVAHLFFYQATYTPLGEYPPSWLDEGFATYHESVSHESMLQQVREAAAKGELVPSRLATGSFGVEEARVGLLYAESLSAVTFLYERWGGDGMAALLEAFRQGANLNEALLQVTGLDFEGFQNAWWDWLGGAPGAYPTPPPWPPPTRGAVALPTRTVLPTSHPADVSPDPARVPFSCLPIGAIGLASGGWAVTRAGGVARRRRQPWDKSNS